MILTIDNTDDTGHRVFGLPEYICCMNILSSLWKLDPKVSLFENFLLSLQLNQNLCQRKYRNAMKYEYKLFVYAYLVNSTTDSCLIHSDIFSYTYLKPWIGHVSQEDHLLLLFSQGSSSALNNFLQKGRSQPVHILLYKAV